MSPPQAAEPGAPTHWPRWISVVIVVSGVVVLVTETTNLLFFAGLALVGIGIYGWVWRSGPTNRPVAIAD